MASPNVALIQRVLWDGAQRSPKAPHLYPGDGGAGQDAQGAQHLTPVQEETCSRRPDLSARRRGEGSVEAILQRVIRKNLTQG